MKKYDFDYFIEKFSNIPEEQWCVGGYTDTDGRRCAMGHCGMSIHNDYRRKATREALMLSRLLSPWHSVMAINDGNTALERLLGSTPKERIINALKKAKILNNGV